MILTGAEIIKEVECGNITINPFNIEQVNPNSYNYRLSEYLGVPKVIQGRQEVVYETIRIPEKGILIHPGSTYLSHTHEKLGSEKYCTFLIGRSSTGRLGLFLQVDADLGHTKSVHNWTLEIVACSNIILYPRMIIGQVSFWENHGDYYHSNIRYNKFNFLNISLD